MRKLLILLSFFLTAAVAWACGDKLMLMMRLRVAQLNLGHPIVVLAYSQRDLPSSVFVRQIQSQPAVQKAGHRFQFIDDTARLDDALKANKYDLVLADLSVADQLNEHANSSPFRPVVLPVAYKTTKAENSAAEKKFHCLLKAPGSSSDYFEAVDEALQWKAKTARR
jgi:hypothetical protein